MRSPSPVIFTTNRLYAREFIRDDADAVFEYSGNADNTAFMDWGPESFEGVIMYIERKIASQIAPKRMEYDFAICDSETNVLIGAMGLFLDNDCRQGMLGYTFNMKYWHNGYAAEAANGFLRFAFIGLDLHRVWAKCDVENIASANVMERIGMRREAHFIKNSYTKVRQELQWRSEYHYAILQKEFLMRLPDGEHSAYNSTLL